MGQAEERDRMDFAGVHGEAAILSRLQQWIPG